MTHITPERIDTLWKQAFDNTEAGGKTSHRFAALLFAEPAPVQEPVATVIKKGADRQWMSERLASLPDGIYSLYTTPPAQQEPVQPVREPVGIKGYAMALNEVALQLRDRYKTDLLSTPLWAEFEKARNKFASSVAAPPAAQRQWVGVSQDELDAMFSNTIKGKKLVNYVARAIEAKLKEKNT